MSKICSSCMGKWTNMRSSVFDALTKKHGEMSATNHPLFRSEMKRLEKVWRKDKEKFETELEKINA